MSQQRSYDCLVIGGGHNGLITAAYLAQAGKSVCVVERRSVLGGCASTEELWPGYRVSPAAYVVSLLQTAIVRDLKLSQHGYRVLRRDPSSFTPLLDGRSLTMSSDMRATRAEIAKFSRRDAERYPDYERLLERVADALDPALSSSAPDLLPLSKKWRKVGVGKRLRDSGRLLELYRAFSTLQDDSPEALEILTGAAKPILERWFDAEVLRATLATDAVIGAFAPPSHPGTAYVLLHHVMGEAGGARGVWGYIEGGMGRLADALESICKQLRVDILRDAAVEKILVQKKRARGVVLADNTVLEAPIVASSVDANLTFSRFVDAGELPDEFRRAIQRIDYSSASAKINLALNGLPQFSCADAGADRLSGTIHISPTMEYIERAYDDAKYGWPSTEPVLEITMPSTVDPSIAPAGKHLMSIFVQYAPYQLAQRSWDEVKDDFADRCLEVLARYAPNIADLIEHRQVLSPLDLERTYGLTGGNIMQGSMHLTQLFSLRPVAGWSDHRSPIRGLYLCGAASHPGGGVMGACGRNAATEILRDFG
ncbi:MAG: NAD(P)/FAD-dependent oxidoreductase [Pirellulaceae bacterium]|jgi:phytoene dehydrogenase-like protein|nr:NAD(P)/FAD-dependent oxidoreductase [Pirellulaceae bacterium]